MSKTVTTKETSAFFLAAVLVAGTFALIFPSFMGGAQAEPYTMEWRNTNQNTHHMEKTSVSNI